MTAKRDHAGDADRIQARHDAGAAEALDKVVATAHLVDLTCYIKGVHDLSACAVGMPLDHTHHRARAELEWTTRSVRLQLVVLDEVDLGFTQHVRQLCGLLRSEADRGLDDGADQRPSLTP